MNFADLYAYVNGLDTEPVSVKALAQRICAFHGDVAEINFYSVELDQKISLGHMVYERDRGSAYDDEFTVANIRIDKELNRCWRRFVGCKEMMHVFDKPEELVNTRERFLRLMSEFEALRMKDDMSPMFFSEVEAQWMAAIILCPERLRNAYRPQLVSKALSDYDVALRLKIPEAIIRGVMSDYYDEALARLLQPQ